MPEDSSATELYFNGINAETGEYDFPPMDGKELTGLLFDKNDQEKMARARPENFSELKAKWQQTQTATFGVVEGVEPQKLEQAGWGIIFAHDADPQIKEALSPLIQWREKSTDGLCQVYEGNQRGHRPNESKTDFLKRVGSKGPGPVDPKKVPYYLLIVGDPNRLPYRFQSQLDVQYAVGRIHFDTIEEYANYAQSVVTAESGKVKLPRTGAFFGVESPGDKATELSTKYLVEPLFEMFQDKRGDKLKGWEFSKFVKDQAKRKQLSEILLGNETPAFLFSASHGMGFPNGDRRQASQQGALLLGDWGGPGSGPIEREWYFAADDLSETNNLLGLIAFFFACYGGGTPQYDEFAKQAFKERAEIAPSNFLAQLPTKMLSRPQGGALAVVGHVERAWGFSFVWPGAGAQTEVFESTIESLLSGKPIGLAMEYFNERYAELSTVLADEVEKIEFDEAYDPYEVAGMWTANNDARGYALLGDPAVRLPVVEEGDDATGRPVIKVSPVPGPAEEVTQPEAAEPGQPGRQTDEPPADDAAGTDFAPLPQLAPDVAEAYPELAKTISEDWINEIQAGYERGNQVFQRILDTFLRDHKTTVIMYWILFLVGIGLFVAGAILAVVSEDNYIPAAIFGGLGVATFVTFFVGRSVQSVEENLEYITWLGIIYNTYWMHQAWAMDPDTAQNELKEANERALAQLEHMIEKHAEARGKRPKLQEE